jgi:hypothetical protein
MLPGLVATRDLRRVDAAQPQALPAVQNHGIPVQHRLNPDAPRPGRNGLHRKQQRQSDSQYLKQRPKKEGNPEGCLGI